MRLPSLFHRGPLGAAWAGFLFCTIATVAPPQPALALEIENHPLIQAVQKELKKTGSTPEIYSFSDRYRLDLILFDLIDQATLLTQDQAGLPAQLERALHPQADVTDFSRWLQTLHDAAEAKPELKRRLDKKLRLQLYSPTAVALTPEYRAIDFQKIKDNSLLVRITRYNEWAANSEAPGLLASFEKNTHGPFITRALTVAKLKVVSPQSLRRAKRKYFEALLALYQRQDPKTRWIQNRQGLRADPPGPLPSRSFRLFNQLQKLPNKHGILLELSREIQGIPLVSGMLILTPTFIEKNFWAIEAALREMTAQQILHSQDDPYLLSVRNFIQDQWKTIEADLARYNQGRSPDSPELKIPWLNQERKPGRIEAIASLEALLTLYPDSPWFDEAHAPTLLNSRGREIRFHKNARAAVGHFFIDLGKNLSQTENYVSLLAGGAALALSQGNTVIALSTRKLVKKAIETERYDREWKEFLEEAPQEVLDAVLSSAGFGAGRFYKVVALGAGQGFIQSIVTGQDPARGAAVGAGLNLVQFYLLPARIARPTVAGIDPRALALNRRLELLEKSVKGTLQGAAVAALEGESIAGGALKGASYGAVSAGLVIWFVGTRYNPFSLFGAKEIDEMIARENEFQNLVGRGGLYEIDRKLIQDGNFRTGGVLPELITASITLPGNVAMSDSHVKELMTLTHEASHLMQQEQSGVFGFYLFRYLPTSLRVSYDGHPDENFLEDFKP